MAQEIRHDGVVDSVDGQDVMVRIVQSSACAGCQASRICRAAESKERLIPVHCADTSGLHAGQAVTVAGAQSMGMKAVAFAFGLPLLLLLAGMITAMAVTGSEKIAAVSALAALAPYYIILFLLRDRIGGSFKFRIIN